MPQYSSAPEWAELFGKAHNCIFSNPTHASFPGLAIFAAVLAFNLVGDHLRDALDSEALQDRCCMR